MGQVNELLLPFIPLTRHKGTGSKYIGALEVERKCVNGKCVAVIVVALFGLFKTLLLVVLGGFIDALILERT